MGIPSLGIDVRVPRKACASVPRCPQSLRYIRLISPLYQAFEQLRNMAQARPPAGWSAALQATGRCCSLGWLESGHRQADRQPAKLGASGLRQGPRPIDCMQTARPAPRRLGQGRSIRISVRLRGCRLKTSPLRRWPTTSEFRRP